MENRRLPNTDLRVSPICLGTMTFGTPVSESEAIKLVHWALDHGVNFIDTANMYEGYTRVIGSAGGVAEEILGKALAGRASEAVIATKVGMKIGPTAADEGLSRAHIFREIDRSLARMGLEKVDLYYAHKPDPNVPLLETIQAFHDLISEGKVAHWALSNFSAAQIEDVLTICDEQKLRRPVAIQPAYSLLKRDIEVDILPLCQRELISVFPFQVLQGGLLTDKYKPGVEIPVNSRLAEKPQWSMPLDEDMFTKLASIREEAEKKGRGMLSHALLSLLEKPMVNSLVLGVKNIEQLENLVKAVA